MVCSTMNLNYNRIYYTPAAERGGGYTVLPLSVLPSIQDIFCRIFLSNYQWQKYDIWSQASYRYPISWEAFLDPSDSYFLFAEEWGYHKWALAHSSSCLMFSLYRILVYLLFSLYRILVYLLFSLYRILVYLLFSLYRILVYLRFNLYRILVYLLFSLYRILV